MSPTRRTLLASSMTVTGTYEGRAHFHVGEPAAEAR